MASNSFASSTSRPVMPVTPLKSHPTPSASKTRRSMSSSSSGSSSPPRPSQAPDNAREHKPPKTARGLCRGIRNSSSNHLAHGDNNNTKDTISNNTIKRTLGTVMPLPREDVTEAQAMSPSLPQDEPLRKRNRRASSSPAAAGKSSDTSIDETKLRMQANPEGELFSGIDHIVQAGNFRSPEW